MDQITAVPGVHLLIPLAGIFVFSAIHLAADRQRDSLMWRARGPVDPGWMPTRPLGPRSR